MYRISMLRVEEKKICLVKLYLVFNGFDCELEIAVLEADLLSYLES